MSDSQADAPVVTVVAGSPTPEELAAIVTVLTAAAAVPEPADERSDLPPIGGWKSHAPTLRRPVHPGPGAWKYAGH